MALGLQRSRPDLWQGVSVTDFAPEAYELNGGL